MSKNLRIVLIEDDSDDVELLQDALETRQVKYEIINLKDGSTALEFFQETDILPDIIVMDFNLPRVHGRDVINFIRSREQFARVPILVLSTSSSKEDINYAYNARADKYLIKPSTLESIEETVQAIVQMAGAGRTSTVNR